MISNLHVYLDFCLSALTYFFSFFQENLMFSASGGGWNQCCLPSSANCFNLCHSLLEQEAYFNYCMEDLS